MKCSQSWYRGKGSVALLEVAGNVAGLYIFSEVWRPTTVSHPALSCGTYNNSQLMLLATKPVLSGPGEFLGRRIRDPSQP